MNKHPGRAHHEPLAALDERVLALEDSRPAPDGPPGQ